MTTNTANGNSLPDDMWLAARLIWENTPKITDGQLIDQLAVKFQDGIPKSTGTISKRRKKEEWAKNTFLEASKRVSKQEESKKSRNNIGKKKTIIPSKTNKAQSMEKSHKQEEKKSVIDGIMDDVVIDAKGRAKVIQKHRKRYEKAGQIFDQAIDVTLSIKVYADEVEAAEQDGLAAQYGGNFEIGQQDQAIVEAEKRAEEAMQKVQKSMVLSKTLTDTAVSLAMGLKMLSEVEMPMCGITPDDFKQSAQELRLNALSQLDGIDEEQRLKRDIKTPLLHQRLRELEEMDKDPSFGRQFDDMDDDEEPESIDYTTVDDD